MSLQPMSLNEPVVLVQSRELFKKIMTILLPVFLFSSAILTQGALRAYSVFALFQDENATYLATWEMTLCCLAIYVLLAVSFIVWAYAEEKTKIAGQLFLAFFWGCLFAILIALSCDFLWIFKQLANKQAGQFFGGTVVKYFVQEFLYYLVLLALMVLARVLQWYMSRQTGRQALWIDLPLPVWSLAGILLPTLLTLPLPLLNLLLVRQNPAQTQFLELPLSLTFGAGSLYLLMSVWIIFHGFRLRAKKGLSEGWLIRLLNGFGMGAAMGLALQIFIALIPYELIEKRTGIGGSGMMRWFGENLSAKALSLLPILLAILIIAVLRHVVKRKQFNIDENNQTSGNFGTAAWADEKELKKFNLYEPGNGLPFAMDNAGRVLYYPLKTKLTLSPQGGGKTVCSSIPVLLGHDGPVFVFDVKGELWATTARYRSQVLGRNVIVIDPYRITKGKDFKKGKPEHLLKEYCFNPFDWVPDDQYARDRMINAFAASFVINEEGGAAVHFDENAKILIRGYIDFMMKKLPKESRKLETLFQLLSEHQEQAILTFQQMAESEGRAAAASNQISRVGSDERGSIMSTTYRQIDWMSDSNVQRALAESNFDLRDFLKGKMDIYVVLPEDQVKEHSRLVRMLMSLLMSLIVQANPSDLPEKKMLFLLEELAQLGYTPDVEKAIEILRGRGVVVWTVFQTLSQVEQFEKPDLFVGAKFKQIFTLDDTETMEWIQTLGGEETVRTKTVSTNTGDSKQKSQVFGGTVSKGEGESVQETGVKLIKMNEIREMAEDEQFIFLHGIKPIRCKKIRYFDHPLFMGKHDLNPLEMKQS